MVWLVLAVLLLGGCQRHKFKQIEKHNERVANGDGGSAGNLESSTVVETQLEPYILFLMMRMQKHAGGEVLQVESHRKVPGTVKNAAALKVPLLEGVRILVFDKTRQRCDTFWQENPLHRHIEVSNENGKLESKTISVEQAEFSIRVSGRDWYNQVVVESVHLDGTSEIITSEPYQL